MLQRCYSTWVALDYFFVYLSFQQFVLMYLSWEIMPLPVLQVSRDINLQNVGKVHRAAKALERENYASTHRILPHRALVTLGVELMGLPLRADWPIDPSSGTTAANQRLPLCPPGVTEEVSTSVFLAKQIFPNGCQPSE